MKNTIYIVCPANKATGGPELLHQLCNQLTRLGYNAYMYYYGKNKNEPVHENYKKYNNKYVNKIKDDPNYIIIVPETRTTFLNKFTQAKRIIWWLSVDNYFNSLNSKRYKLETLFGFRKFDYKTEDIIHLAQSKYAEQYLKEEGICEKNIYYLSDYLNETFLKNANKNIDKDTRKDYILYNPKKGYEFTKKLIEKNPNLQWKELANLTPNEMLNLLKESKVYVDFGNHPGKDRIPREAAINGCCVITGLKGSAKYYEDVSIPSEFKFDDCDDEIDKILMKIQYITKKFDKENKKFEEYRNIIRNEQNKFETDVKSVFEKILKKWST